jgi:hypothetical protein
MIEMRKNEKRSGKGKKNITKLEIILFFRNNLRFLLSFVKRMKINKLKNDEKKGFK